MCGHLSILCVVHDYVWCMSIYVWCTSIMCVVYVHYVCGVCHYVCCMYVHTCGPYMCVVCVRQGCVKMCVSVGLEPMELMACVVSITYQ